MPEIKAPLSEVGKTGLDFDVWSGMVTERYVSNLDGSDGIAAFDEMRRRDPSIRSLLYGTKLMSRTIGDSGWKAVGASDKGVDKEAADFLDECLGDMSHTMTDAVDDFLSMLPFGWYWCELCYKRREGKGGGHPSLFDDKRIGWRKWAPRKQTSWSKWELDDTGGLQALWQRPPSGYEAIRLPIEKSLHFTTEPDGGNPEGVSLLESCYEHWYFLKNLLPILGIGFERSFTGLPHFHYEERPSDDDRTAVEAMGKGLRVGAKAFAATPPGVLFELLSTTNASAEHILDAIQYFRLLILQSALADYINLGVGATGSFALGRDKSELFIMGANGWLDKIQAVLNRFAVPRLFAYNDFPGLVELPRIEHDVIRKPDLAGLGEFVNNMAQAVPMRESDAVWLRERAGMPPASGGVEVVAQPTAQSAAEGELSEGWQITDEDRSQAQRDFNSLRELLSA